MNLICRRFIQLLLVLFLLSIFTFSLMKLAPGDPVRSMLQTDYFAVTKQEEVELRQELGFDLPILIQYGKWIKGVLQLDFGKSYLNGKPVWDELMRRIPVTLELTLGAFVVMVLITVPLGVLAACYPNKFPDHLGRFLALMGASIPSFWFGLLLIHLFALELQWLSSIGRGTITHMILPSVTLGFSMATIYARLLRTGLLESFSQEYIRAARARGVQEWRILLFHALRAAMLPIITVFGMNIGYLLGGSVVTEMLFSWPGLGSMVIDAINGRDYPVIQGYIIFIGFFVVVINLLVDLFYFIIDPRIRHGEGLTR
nr:nickel ABC transporter permease [Risungbinella massiliensis]